MDAQTDLDMSKTKAVQSQSEVDAWSEKAAAAQSEVDAMKDKEAKVESGERARLVAEMEQYIADVVFG